jgi:hypothetical protein
VIDNSPPSGMVGPFWLVEADGQTAIIAIAIPLERANPYGDMLTVDTGHFQHWEQLRRRGARALQQAGIPTAPVWSEYDEWPRGRVLYDRTAAHFVVRADRQLFQPAFMRLIMDHFGIVMNDAIILTDDHYRSVRRLLISI